MTVYEKLKGPLDIIGQDDVDCKLFLITRHLKEGKKKTERILDKYEFKANTIYTEQEVNDQLKTIVTSQLNGIIKKPGYELTEYSVLDDDIGETLYTYALNNAVSFFRVVDSQMFNHEYGNVKSLEDVKRDLWAYCIRFGFMENTVYIFRKLSSGKITTDKAKGTRKSLKALFSMTDAKLHLAEEQMIVFDNMVDCLFYQGEFLVFRKNQFEQLAGLEEEFLNTANKVIEEIETTEMVEGLDLIKDLMHKSPRILKSLSGIGKKNNHSGLNTDEIWKMKKALKMFEDRDLKTSPEGKIQISDENDVKDFIRLLNDYYKQAVVTGKYYGSTTGHILKPTT